MQNWLVWHRRTSHIEYGVRQQQSHFEWADKIKKYTPIVKDIRMDITHWMKNQIELIYFSCSMNWLKYNTIVCWIFYILYLPQMVPWRLAHQKSYAWCISERISIFNPFSWCSLNISLFYAEQGRQHLHIQLSKINCLVVEWSSNSHFICFTNRAIELNSTHCDLRLVLDTLFLIDKASSVSSVSSDCLPCYHVVCRLHSFIQAPYPIDQQNFFEEESKNPSEIVSRRFFVFNVFV